MPTFIRNLPEGMRPSARCQTVANYAAMLALTHFGAGTSFTVNDNGKEVFLSDSGQTWSLLDYSGPTWGFAKRGTNDGKADFAALGNVNLSAVTAAMLDVGAGTVGNGSTFLAPGQTTASQNGVYVISGWNGSNGTATRVPWLSANGQCWNRTVQVKYGATGTSTWLQVGTALTALTYQRQANVTAPSLTVAAALPGLTVGQRVIVLALPDGTPNVAYDVVASDSGTSDGLYLVDAVGVQLRQSRVLGNSTHDLSSFIGKPSLDDDAAGYTLLQGCLVWGSSTLAATTVTGPGALNQAALLALTPTELTISAATGIDGTSSGALLLPSTNNTGHIATYGGSNPIGARMKLTICWKPNAIVTGQASSIAIIMGNAGSLVYFRSASDGMVAAPSSSQNPHYSQARTWKRADGWSLSEFTWYNEQANAGFKIYVCNNNGTTTYTADGTTGIVICNVTFSEVRATSLTNCSTGTATITGTSTTAPMLEDSTCPEDGWVPDGSNALRFLGGESRVLSFSSPAYSGISGTAQVVTLPWLWAPYQAPLADATIWNFTGSSSVLKIEHTTASKLKVTRTTDASVTTTVTFDHVVGFVPQACSIVLDGTSAMLYLQYRLIETKAFSLAGTTTFTAGTFGGALSARAAEFALKAAAWTATQVRQAHAKLARNRGWRIEPIPVWIPMGQSNSLALCDGSGLTTFGPPSRNRPAIHYEMATPAGVSWANSQVLYSGWGPSRTQHPKSWGDAPLPLFTGGSGQYHNSDQYFYGHDTAFAARMGYVATIRFGVGGIAIAEMLPGGSQNANMLAALQDAFDTIGIPYKVRGFIFIWGESDSNDFALANIYGQQMVAMVDYLCEQFDIVSPMLVMNRIHASAGYPYESIVRSQQELLAQQYDWAQVIDIDDVPVDAGDIIHWRTGATHVIVGERQAEAAKRLCRRSDKGRIEPVLSSTPIY